MLRSFLLCNALFLLFGCVEQEHDEGRGPGKGTDEDLGELAVPSFSYAERIHAEAKGKGVRVLIEMEKDTVMYLLYPKAVDLPKEADPSDAIRVPVKSMIGLSASHIGMLEALGKKTLLKGVSSYDHVHDEWVRGAIKSGDVLEVAPGGAPNVEKVVGARPEVLLVNGLDQGKRVQTKALEHAGTKRILHMAWKESHPLGKAEWVKLMGLLTARSDEADSLYNEIRHEYEALRERIKNENIENKPEVICNSSYKGSWFVPGGGSYMATFFKDAGASYPWSGNDRAGGVRLGLEEVFEKAHDADVWVNPGRARSLKAVRDKDERLASIQAFQNGEVYNNTERAKPDGGNDYWEQGVMEPHVVLADLVHIFHPELMPDHKLVYFEQLR